MEYHLQSLRYQAQTPLSLSFSFQPAFPPTFQTDIDRPLALYEEQETPSLIQQHQTTPIVQPGRQLSKPAAPHNSTRKL